MSKKSKISRRNAIKTFALGSSTLAFPKFNHMISTNSIKKDINFEKAFFFKEGFVSNLMTDFETFLKNWLLRTICNRPFILKGSTAYRACSLSTDRNSDRYNYLLVSLGFLGIPYISSVPTFGSFDNNI